MPSYTKYILTFFSLSLMACGNDSPDIPSNVESFPIISPPNQSIILREDQQALSESYAVFRKSQIANPQYSLSVELNANSDTFNGEVSINFDLVSNNASPITIDYDSGEVLEVTVNDTEVEWDFEHWYISLSAELFMAGKNTINIRYKRPFSSDGVGLHKFTDPENAEVYLYTHFEPFNANRLFPHFDQPNLKAPITLDVLAPNNWQVIGNTRETRINNDGDKRHWFFPASASISSYTYALHAGPFAVWEDQAGDIPLRLFSRSALASFVQTEEWFVPTRQSFAFFQEYFDVPYPFTKYDQVIVPDFNAGAMENVAAVTFNERYISRGEKSSAQLRGLASVIAHEMAHMWFGDLVTMDWWNGLWLNESFATYMANLELERASDFDNVWDSFFSDTKQWAYETDQLITTHPIELSVPSTSDAFTNFDGITYGKGASVLKQLPYFLGEENFRLGVSHYLKKYSYQNTSLDDFVNELALAANLNLDQWKQEWLYQSGLNTIQADFTCENNKISSLSLLQSAPKVSTADKILRSQRTQIGLYRYTDEKMVLSNAIAVTYSGAVTEVVDAIGSPCPDMVFPNEDDWAFIKISLDATSLETLNEHINDFENPTTRIMLWQSLWDNVLDTQMSLTDFVDYALNNIAEEQDENVLTQVTTSLDYAFGYFSKLGGYESEKATIENFLWKRLNNAEPESEAQKIWYNSFSSHAHTEDALQYLKSLMTATESITGLEIDQDKRWNIVISLNRYEFEDYETVLKNEQQRDASDQGQNMSIAAQVIRPQRAVKETWLNTIINEPDTYKLATLRLAMAYLFPNEQGEFLAEYSKQIINVIPTINEGNQGYLDEYVNNLLPATCTAQSIEQLAQANEDFADLDVVVVKAYKILHQEDQWCVDIGAAMTHSL